MEQEALTRAEARLPRWMAACAVVGVVAALAAGGVRPAAAFALGAALAVLNYRWLHQAVETIFGEDHTRVPRGVVAKFAVRYPLAFAAVYLFYRTGWLPFGAILAGLFVPVVGAIIEAVTQLATGGGPRPTDN
jgi:ATP synthase I subunit